MFFDFSSAFNTIQPHLMAQKLLKMNLCSSIVLWVFNYQPQFVVLKGTAVVWTNTQGP